MTKKEIEKIVAEMRADATLIVERGSVLFGSVNEHSDKDQLVVVPNEYREFLSNHPNGIFEHHCQVDASLIDTEFICEDDFQSLIDKCDVMAVEALCTPYSHVLYYDKSRAQFKIPTEFDKWKIRQSFSGTASNSWAKAHKKMTVLKDLDIYRGKKSLFHSLRILMFAIQVCEKGDIHNFKEAQSLWDEIYASTLTWDEYKEKYKPLYNKLRSKLAILAPKPVEK